MPSLHIVNQSPYSHTTLADCLAHIDVQDSILLIEDGVYAITHNLFKITHEQYPNRLYVLKSDITARGIIADTDTNIIDYLGMVTLTENHHPIQSWF